MWSCQSSFSRTKVWSLLPIVLFSRRNIRCQYDVVVQFRSSRSLPASGRIVKSAKRTFKLWLCANVRWREAAFSGPMDMSPQVWQPPDNDGHQRSSNGHPYQQQSSNQVIECFLKHLALAAAGLRCLFLCHYSSSPSDTHSIGAPQ